MHDRDAEAPASAAWLRAVALSCLLLALGMLAWQAARSVNAAMEAAGFPLSLDYGEGIVVQQALLMLGGEAYGDITREPFIVFHYPPIYHLALRGLGWLGGVEPSGLVLIGRWLSIAATLVAAGAVGVLVARILAPGGRVLVPASGAAAGALVLLITVPVAHWMPYARVDMLAIALTMAGLAVAAGTGRAALRVAVVLFVLAVFTKQTSVAAPIALVLVTLLADRRRGIEAACLGLGLGLAGLAAAQVLTGGGFLHHVVGYNVNRFALDRVVQQLAWPLLTHAALIGAAVIALHAVAGIVWRKAPGGPRALVRIDVPARGVALVMVHFLICTAMLVLIGKTGSNINYLIEWFCALSILVGIGFGRAMAAAQGQRGVLAAGPLGATLFAVLLMGQATRLPPLPQPPAGAAAATSVQRLLALTRDADRPVISDDMVLLLNAGRQVHWEPAIFAELAHLGAWDEQPFIAMIDQGHFAFAATLGQRGSEPFDSRYNPAVADAMDRVWPRKLQIGWMTLHLPDGHPAAAVPRNEPSP